uniref:Poly(RC)-binding protein 3 n=1 Tax=Aceria tosichella TaxID=561515 RepID=A0A6G1SGT2_9ACAR
MMADLNDATMQQQQQQQQQQPLHSVQQQLATLQPKLEPLEHESQQQVQPNSQQQPQSNSDMNGGQLALTLRLLMQGKEVGSIIGKKGDNIKRFREVSGAKINVSDSSCPDRIVTLSGTLDEVYNAFSMICSKFEEQILQVNTSSGVGANISSILAGPQAGAGGPAPTSGSSPTNSVNDPLFGLPAGGILGTAIKERSLSGKEGELLTINNNSTTTINNNNLNAPNKNLIANNNNNNVKRDNSAPGSTTGSLQQGGASSHPTVTIRLIVPASQCGSLIGRGGAKIKELRELTSAIIQVAPDVLPNSTERVVTIIGSVASLRQCTYQICKIMVESPPKGYVLPYRPKPALNPMLLAAATAGQAAAAYNLPGQFALSAHPDVNRLFVANNPLAAAFNPTAAANLRAAAASGQAAAALSAVASQQMSSQEIAIPNGLIGCVIGKGGSKINEIRQLSGANIKISNTEEGSKNRTVTINGTPEAINVAQYLITASCNGHQGVMANKSTRKFAPY